MSAESPTEVPGEAEWVECLDDQGRTYYYNSLTGESKWSLEPPDGNASTPGASSGREASFAQNAEKEEDESVDLLPTTNRTDGGFSVGQLAGKSTHRSLKSVARSFMLLSKWTKYKDPASGADYYYNNVSGESQWEQPEDFDKPPTLLDPTTEKTTIEADGQTDAKLAKPMSRSSILTTTSSEGAFENELHDQIIKLGAEPVSGTLLPRASSASSSSWLWASDELAAGSSTVSTSVLENKEEIRPTSTRKTISRSSNAVTLQTVTESEAMIGLESEEKSSLSTREDQGIAQVTSVSLLRTVSAQSGMSISSDNLGLDDDDEDFKREVREQMSGALRKVRQSVRATRLLSGAGLLGSAPPSKSLSPTAGMRQSRISGAMHMESLDERDTTLTVDVDNLGEGVVTVVSPTSLISGPTTPVSASSSILPTPFAPVAALVPSGDVPDPTRVSHELFQQMHNNKSTPAVTSTESLTIESNQNPNVESVKGVDPKTSLAGVSSNAEVGDANIYSSASSNILHSADLSKSIGASSKTVDPSATGSSKTTLENEICLEAKCTPRNPETSTNSAREEAPRDRAEIVLSGAAPSNDQDQIEVSQQSQDRVTGNNPHLLKSESESPSLKVEQPPDQTVERPASSSLPNTLTLSSEDLVVPTDSEVAVDKRHSLGEVRESSKSFEPHGISGSELITLERHMPSKAPQVDSALVEATVTHIIASGTTAHTLATGTVATVLSEASTNLRNPEPEKHANQGTTRSEEVLGCENVENPHLPVAPISMDALANNETSASENKNVSLQTGGSEAESTEITKAENVSRIDSLVKATVSHVMASGTSAHTVAAGAVAAVVTQASVTVRTAALQDPSDHLDDVERNGAIVESAQKPFELVPPESSLLSVAQITEEISQKIQHDTTNRPIPQGNAPLEDIFGDIASPTIDSLITTVASPTLTPRASNLDQRDASPREENCAGLASTTVAHIISSGTAHHTIAAGTITAVLNTAFTVKASDTASNGQISDNSAAASLVIDERLHKDQPTLVNGCLAEDRETDYSADNKLPVSEGSGLADDKIFPGEDQNAEKSSVEKREGSPRGHVSSEEDAILNGDVQIHPIEKGCETALPTEARRRAATAMAKAMTDVSVSTASAISITAIRTTTDIVNVALSGNTQAPHSHAPPTESDERPLKKQVKVNADHLLLSAEIPCSLESQLSGSPSTSAQRSDSPQLAEILLKGSHHPKLPASQLHESSGLVSEHNISLSTPDFDKATTKPSPTLSNDEENAVGGRKSSTVTIANSSLATRLVGHTVESVDAATEMLRNEKDSAEALRPESACSGEHRDNTKNKVDDRTLSSLPAETSQAARDELKNLQTEHEGTESADYRFAPVLALNTDDKAKFDHVVTEGIINETPKGLCLIDGMISVSDVGSPGTKEVAAEKQQPAILFGRSAVTNPEEQVSRPSDLLSMTPQSEVKVDSSPVPPLPDPLNVESNISFHAIAERAPKSEPKTDSTAPGSSPSKKKKKKQKQKELHVDQGSTSAELPNEEQTSPKPTCEEARTDRELSPAKSPFATFHADDIPYVQMKASKTAAAAQNDGRQAGPFYHEADCDSPPTATKNNPPHNEPSLPLAQTTVASSKHRGKLQNTGSSSAARTPGKAQILRRPEIPADERAEVDSPKCAVGSIHATSTSPWKIKAAAAQKQLQEQLRLQKEQEEEKRAEMEEESRRKKARENFRLWLDDKNIRAAHLELRKKQEDELYAAEMQSMRNRRVLRLLKVEEATRRRQDLTRLSREREAEALKSRMEQAQEKAERRKILESMSVTKIQAEENKLVYKYLGFDYDLEQTIMQSYNLSPPRRKPKMIRKSQIPVRLASMEADPTAPRPECQLPEF